MSNKVYLIEVKTSANNKQHNNYMSLENKFEGLFENKIKAQAKMLELYKQYAGGVYYRDCVKKTPTLTNDSGDIVLIEIHYNEKNGNVVRRSIYMTELELDKSKPTKIEEKVHNDDKCKFIW